MKSGPPELERVFVRVAQERRLLTPGSRVLAGVSAGADSVALLRLLHASSEALSIAVVVAHVNHGMREAAGLDQAFTEDLAARLGLPCASLQVAKAPRNEEQARLARHRLLAEAARAHGCARIALAHTMDDQAETLLMRLARGTGRRGLSGMRWEGPGLLVRPLLGTRRATLRSYLAALDQPFREDESNQDLRRLRNRVRARLLPVLTEMNPSVVPSLARAAQLMADEDAWLDQQAAAWVARHAWPAAAVRGGTAAEDARAIAAPARELAALAPPLARRAARLLLRAAGADPRGVSLHAIDRLLDLAGRAGGAASLDLPGGMTARRAGLDLVVSKRHVTSAIPSRDGGTKR